MAWPNLGNVELLLVRHAHAGSKQRWRDDDRLRPLSERGRDEAAALVDMIAPYEPVRIVSSPYLRCLQTVEPLAERLDLPVEESSALEPDADEAAVELLRSLALGPGPVVVCTHGETIERLQRRLLPLRRQAARRADTAREKGSVWVLEAKKGRFTSAHYLPPRRGGEGAGRSEPRRAGGAARRSSV